MTGEDKLSAVVQKNQKRLDSFMKTAKNPAGLKSLSVNIKAASNQFTELNSKVSLVSAATSAAGGTFSSFFEFAKSGELANMVEHSFLQMAGSAEAYASKMGALRESTAFLIDETSLQQFSNRMAFMGVGIQETTRILEIATAAAKVSGDDLMGLARRVGEAAMTGRSTALKQMGVMINLNKVQEDYARSIGKTRAELSAFEKGTVTLDAALEDIQTKFISLGVFTEDLDSSVSQITKTLDDFESNMQQKFAKSMAEAKKSVDEMFDNEAHRRSIKGQIATILELSKVLDENGGISAKGKTQADATSAAVDRLTKKFKLNAKGTADVRDQLDLLFTMRGRNLPQMEEMIIKIAKMNILQGRRGQIMAAQTKIEETTALAENERLAVVAKRQEIEELGVELQRAQNEKRSDSVAAIKTEIAARKTEIRLIQGKITKRQAELETETQTLTEMAALDAIEAQRIAAAESKRAKSTAKKTKAKADALRAEKDQIKIATSIKVLEIQKAIALDDEMTVHQKLLAENRIRVIQHEGREKAGEFRNDRQRALTLQVLRAQNRQRELASLKEFNQREQEERKENARATFEMEGFNISHVFEMKQAALEQHLDQVSAGANSFATAFAPANQMMAESDRRMSDWQIGTVNAFQAVGDVAQVAAKNTDNLANAVGPGLSAMKGLTRGLVKDKQAEAGIHAAFEAAAAAASFATGNIPAGIAHSAAAGMFLAIAGGAGKSTKAKASSQGTFGAGGAQGAQSVSAGPSSVVLNVNGFVSADQNQLAKGMQDTLSGITGGGFVGGTI
tara:strand:+ start:310 stop:2688 length:2379 start_codon:yes stop_codon:yes gene_type:complete